MKLEEVKEDLGQDVSLEMVLIPAGTFVMGSPESEEDRNDDEVQHLVTLTKPYYMGKYEVTQEQWKAVMGKNPSQIKGNTFPVTDVSWNDCQNFIKKLNSITEGGYRLPTEAEWEYACRAGTTTAYFFGGSLAENDANINGERIKSVGSYKPNAFGLYDMHGNVHEICKDWYAKYPTGVVIDPKGPAKGKEHIVRGGAVGLTPYIARSSRRGKGGDTNHSSYTMGFRLARSITT
jgi:formylglycine-generating enzyme required for sulfatase activity